MEPASTRAVVGNARLQPRLRAFRRAGHGGPDGVIGRALGDVAEVGRQVGGGEGPWPAQGRGAEPAARQEHVPLLPGLVEEDIRLAVRGPLERRAGNVLERGLAVEQEHLGGRIGGDDLRDRTVRIGLGRNGGARVVPVAVVGELLQRRRQLGDGRPRAFDRAGGEPVGIVAQVEGAAVLDPEEVPIGIDQKREPVLALDGRKGRRAVGLNQDRRARRHEDRRRIGLEPGHVGHALLLGQAGRHARLRDGDRTGREELAGLDRERRQVVASEAREIQLGDGDVADHDLAGILVMGRRALEPDHPEDRLGVGRLRKLGRHQRLDRLEVGPLGELRLIEDDAALPDLVAAGPPVAILAFLQVAATDEAALALEGDGAPAAGRSQSPISTAVPAGRVRMEAKFVPGPERRLTLVVVTPGAAKRRRRREGRNERECDDLAHPDVPRQPQELRSSANLRARPG